MSASGWSVHFTCRPRLAEAYIELPVQWHCLKSFLGMYLTYIQPDAQQRVFLGLLNRIESITDEPDEMCQAKKNWPRKSMDANIPTLL
jgi:hypothetical protein